MVCAMPSAPQPYRGLPIGTVTHSAARGLTQFSLVEHALCPIDAATSLQPNLVHHAHHFFTDTKTRTRKKATARVLCPDGLSASDEFYLWGLLALTFSQSEPLADFQATPYFCLRQLGLIDARGSRGGKSFELF